MKMELRLTHQNGPLSGETHKFMGDVRRIRIGRDPECEICFPPEFNAIASHVHCELEKDASKYEVRVDTSYRVLVNGEEALDGQELQHGDKLTVGARENSVTLVVELVKTTLKDGNKVVPIPGTMAQGHEQIEDDVTVSRRARKNLKRLGIVAVVVATLVAYNLLRSDANEKRIQQNRDAFLAKLEKQGTDLSQKLLDQTSALEGQLAAQKLDFQDAIALSEKSLYLVSVINSEQEYSPVGTAWVTENGYLATNAHVAAVIDDLLAGIDEHRVVVKLSTAPFTEHEVVSTIVHPAYRPFEKMWYEYKPVRIDATGADSIYEYSSAYDVALLEVTNAEALGPPLPLAGEEEMQNLRRGYPIAFNGFPMESLLEFDPRRPIANAQTGIITSITDFFRISSFDPAGNLIHHSLPAAGGASGSPIFNKRGEVIALLNGGNVIWTSGGRSANAANINFAQRVDLLKELLDPAPIDLEALQMAWKDGFSNFESTESLERERFSIDNIKAEWEQYHDRPDEAVEILQSSFNIAPEEDEYTGVATVEKVIDLAEPGHYLVLAESQSDPLRDIDMIILDGAVNEVDHADEHVLGSDRVEDHVPYIDIETDRAMRVYAYVIDGGLLDDIQYDDDIDSRVRLYIFFLPQG